MTLLPTPEMPATTVVLPRKYPPFSDVIEAGNAGGHAGRRIVGGRPITFHRAGGLDAAIYLNAMTIDNPEGVTSHLEIMAARLHDLDRSDRRARLVLHPQTDDGIGDRFFRQRGRVAASEGAGLHGQDGGQVFTLQPFDQQMERLPVLLPVDLAEDARPTPSTKMRRAPISAASSRSRLSACCSSWRNTCRVVKTILSEPLLLERREIPSQPRRVAHEFVRRHLEQHDQAGLAELARPPVDELNAERGLSGSDRAFQEDHVAAWNSHSQDGIEPGYSSLDRI